ncbi:MAG: beta-propeller fold lactonase family protein, partial [Candidatus Sulfotelmatobacter sp.]
AQNASAVSSCAVNRNETLTAISLKVLADANASCWHAIAPDGRFVYTPNPRSGSISGFSISLQGALTPIAGTVLYSLPTGSSNLDTTVISDSRFLYTLNSGSGTVGMFAINQDGTLTSLGEACGLTANGGYNGIAAKLIHS